MTAQAMTKPSVELTPTARTAEREYVHPVVRALPMPTAHPSREAWPIAAVRRSQPAQSGKRSSSFAELQTRMAATAAAGLAGRDRSLVIVPSRTIESWRESPAVTQAIEERLLCSLLELRDPTVRLTYVTSAPVAPAIIDYYLSLLPPRIRRSARSRLTLVALGERTARPLSEKLLHRPRVLERIRRTIPDVRSCHLVPYNTTSLERDVAIELGIPMYGADPCHAHLGTKSGCRALFARAGVAHPLGFEGITTVGGAIDAIVKLRTARPTATRVVMKLNDGVSGEGNAIIDLEGLPRPGAPDEWARVGQRLTSLAPEAQDVSAAAFLARLARGGGIVEEWITADEVRSPSVQLQITPGGEVQIVSTHDQILGGPTGQRFLACRFPSAPCYATAISGIASRVGQHLADAGVIGRCAIDFVVARDTGADWRPFAIELNLRKGGTTHPYETLAHLTGGTYNPDSATFTTPTGRQKHYVATDHLEAPELRELGRDGVLALARRRDLRFEPILRKGAVFHMVSSVDELGRTGFTAIGDSAEDADALYQHVEQTLLREARTGGGAQGHSYEYPSSVAYV